MSSDGESAGTYVKLQDAYFTEQNMYGGWGKIGYTAAGQGSSTSFKGNTFTYRSGMGWTAETNVATTTGAWMADNTETALNDCAKHDAATGTWKIELADPVGTTTAYTVTPPSDANCAVLTPSFKKIGQ